MPVNAIHYGDGKELKTRASNVYDNCGDVLYLCQQLILYSPE
jgi:hypothetical protein